jgi:hypothetical protein
MTLTLALLVSCASFLTGCTKDNIVPPEEESEEVVKTAREVLSEIKGVTIIDDDKDVDGNDIIKFFFEQPVDHKNPAAGKFSQYCVLHYKGPKNITFCIRRVILSPRRKKRRCGRWIWQSFSTPTIWR